MSSLCFVIQARHPVCSSYQHYQWEDLRLPMVCTQTPPRAHRPAQLTYSSDQYKSVQMAQHVDLLPRFWLCILSVLTILDLGHHFILVTFRGVRWVILNRKLNTAPKFKVSSSNLEWLSCQLLPFNFFSLSRWTLTWHWSLAAWVMATGSCVITSSGRN